ncbi:hypothetical protein K8Q98_00330 [Candidatus Nomurabacteria bacterium]|nr:hypothetical protein [Candidatus Nomurabacteria bacterium]
MPEKLFSFLKREVSKRLSQMLDSGAEIWVPLCPDYVPGGIADGVSSLMLDALSASAELQTRFPKTSLLFFLADTEEDVLKDFNREPVRISREKLSCEIKRRSLVGSALLFSDAFPDWHVRQYEMESKVRDEIKACPDLEHFFQVYEDKRRERYSLQYNGGVRLASNGVRALQIRHYAQYLLLREIMHEREQLVLMNYQTENLRAVTKIHSFQPERRRLELVVY